MDFRLEAAAAAEFAENLADDPDFRAPQDRLGPHHARSADDGVDRRRRRSAIPARSRRSASTAALGRQLIQSFLRHALRDGFFHADMHQGNFLVDAEGRIVAVDFGIMGRLGRRSGGFWPRSSTASSAATICASPKCISRPATCPRHYRVEDFAQAIRAIGEPIHARPADQISMARLLTLLFEVTALFDMTTRIELVMLQKTMVVVEGVARKLDPRLNMWATAEPVVGDWIADNLGPRGRIEDAGAALRGCRPRAVAGCAGPCRADARRAMRGDRARALIGRSRLRWQMSRLARFWVIAAIVVWIAHRIESDANVCDIIGRRRKCSGCGGELAARPVGSCASLAARTAESSEDGR